MVVKDVRGFTLVEAIVAVAILTVMIVAVLSGFASQTASNARSERRTAAVSAAEQAIEFLRMEDPATMPDTGVVGPQAIVVNDRQYEVYTRFCVDTTLCKEHVRHITVEVQLDGSKIYDVETVFTQLR